MTGALFVDSWGWIVLAHQKEPRFESVKEIYEQALQEDKIVTSDFVLDEVVTFLFSKAAPSQVAEYLKKLFASLSSSFIHLERVTSDRFENAWKMRLKYSDHPKISFTDFTSFVIMKELSIKRILTQDRHFEEVNLGFTRLPAP